MELTYAEGRAATIIWEGQQMVPLVREMALQSALRRNKPAVSFKLLFKFFSTQAGTTSKQSSVFNYQSETTKTGVLFQ